MVNSHVYIVIINHILELIRNHVNLMVMSHHRTPRLKPLLDKVPPGFMVDTPWLKAQCIDPKSIHDYVARGWLERVVRGVYRRPLPEGVEGAGEASWKVVLPLPTTTDELRRASGRGKCARPSGLRALSEPRRDAARAVPWRRAVLVETAADADRDRGAAAYAFRRGWDRHRRSSERGRGEWTGARRVALAH